MDFTAEIYNVALLMIEDLCLEVVNRVFSQLGMQSQKRSFAPSFDEELRRELKLQNGRIFVEWAM